MMPFISSEANESFCFSVIFSLTLEIKRKTQVGHLEFSGQVEETSTPHEMERSLSHCGKTGMLVKDKKGTLVKSCKESSKRESDVVVMADELVSVETLDEHTRGMVKKRLQHLW